MSNDPLAPGAVLDVVQKLVAIPSVNPSLAPAEGQGELAAATFCRDWLVARGIRAWLEEAAPGRPNAVAEIGTGKGPTLVFCAHLDTVATSGMTIAPFEPRVHDGRLYGRGSYDMKGSAGAMLAAAAALAAEPDVFQGRVLLALVADEEYASLGAIDFVARHAADACIVTEPSEGRLILAHKGFMWLELETRGRAAHGSRWDLGVSAIATMGRLVAALETFDRAELRRRTHPLVGPASMHCAGIEGGVGWSTYAPSCRLRVERRMIPGESPEEVEREIATVATRAAGDDVRVTRVFDRPSLVCDRDAAIAACLRDAIAATTGLVPEEAGVAYWMDAAVFAQAGIPTVNYGPSGAGAHEAIEWVEIDSLVRVARVLVESARRFCVRA